MRSRFKATVRSPGEAKAKCSINVQIFFLYFVEKSVFNTGGVKLTEAVNRVQTAWRKKTFI